MNFRLNFCGFAEFKAIKGENSGFCLNFYGFFVKNSIEFCHIERSEISQNLIEILLLFAKGSK